MQKAVKAFPNVLFVAGYEHNLQIIKDSSYNYIASGSGTKHTHISLNKNALFTSALNGYAVLDISENKNAGITFYTVMYVPHAADSITVAANKNYAKAPAAKKFFNGNNYGDIWGQNCKAESVPAEHRNGRIYDNRHWRAPSDEIAEA